MSRASSRHLVVPAVYTLPSDAWRARPCSYRSADSDLVRGEPPKD